MLIIVLLTNLQEKLDKTVLRRDFLNTDAATKLANLKRNNEALQRQLEDRTLECNALEGKIAALNSTVSQSENVMKSRDAARGATGDPVNIAAARMKRVVSRRHMVDTARAQAEEIDFLRQELDRMRQRTFPSFVR